MEKTDKTWIGDDEDYGLPYGYHKYDDKDSDRGANDEHHQEEDNG